jgi:hypothetical protein
VQGSCKIICAKVSGLALSFSETNVGSGKIRVEIDGPPKEHLRESVILSGGLTQMPQSALIGGPGVEVPGWFPHRALLLGLGDGWGNRGRHRLGDLILQHKNVGEVAVVVFCPGMLAGVGLDELRGNANAVISSAQAAFEHITHAELARDLPHIDRAALVGEARIASYDEQ